MTQALEQGGLTSPQAPLPPQFAELMWPELPSMAREIIAEVRRAIPEYARPMDGPYGRVLRLGAERLLHAFVEKVARPSTTFEDRDDMCRRLGQFEAHEGRSLDKLQAAYRIGLQMAWRRMIEVGERHGIDPSMLTLMGEALIAYVDELAAQSVRGYLEAQAQTGKDLEERRLRLLRHILEDPPLPRQAITEMAERAGWTVPDRVTLVAVRAGRPCMRTLLDGDLLVDLNCAEPYILIPGTVDAERRQMLEAVLAGAQAAVGLTMPLTSAAASLRWARQALVLAAGGFIADDPITWCDDHLLTLWLLSDVELAEQLAQRELAALTSMSDGQRDRLAETLSVWLATRGTAAEMGARLRVHPQTVRYRMRQLDHALGESLRDPQRRFSIELLFRAAEFQAPTVQGSLGRVVGRWLKGRDTKGP